MTWFDILKDLEFKGGIVYNISEGDLPSNATGPILEGHDMLDTFHMTLFSPQEMKPFKEVHELSNKEAKLKVRELINEFNKPYPPLKLHLQLPNLAIPYERQEATGRGLSVATRGNVETAFVVIKNQGAWQDYINDLAKHLGIPTVQRFFHVSVSNNQGGNPYKSIGDINEGDVER